MSDLLKNKMIEILESGSIEDLKMILQFRWLEYLNPNEFYSIAINTKINFLNNLRKIIFHEILDEHNYYRGRIVKYMPRILLNIIQSIDSEFLEKIILMDELHDQNKEDLIWLLNSNLESQDFQQKKDKDGIIRILNKK